MATAASAGEAGSTASSALREDTVVDVSVALRPATAVPATATCRRWPRMWVRGGQRRVPMLHGTRPRSRPARLASVCGLTWDFATCPKLPKRPQRMNEGIRTCTRPSGPGSWTSGRGRDSYRFAAIHRMSAGSPTKRVLQGQRGRRGSAQVVDQHGEGHRL